MRKQSERLLAWVIHRRKKQWEILEEEEAALEAAEEEVDAEEAEETADAVEAAAALEAEAAAALEEAEEISAPEKCIKQFVLAVGRNVKFHLSQQKDAPCIVGNVFSNNDHNDKKF